MLDSFSEEEIQYFVMLYAKYPHNKELLIEKMKLWGSAKYEHHKYKLPKFLDKCDKLLQKLKIIEENTK